MFQVIRTRITPATVIATIALILAMTGGAYAASRFLITSTKQIKPSVLAQLKGRAGATGAAGPAGPQGPAGAVGTGTLGPEGKAGAPGQSVTSAAASAGECPSGGSKLTSASGTSAICNGKAGKEGPEGSPWTAGGTLPAGATETGVWVLGEVPSAGGAIGVSFAKTAISFPIPLAKRIAEEAKIHVFQGTTIPTGCSGTVAGGNVTELKAAEGNLCMWIHAKEGFNKGNAELLPEDPETGSPGVGTHGAVIGAAGEEGASAEGTWAVTG
jgi:hypothetical protein